MYYLTSSTKVTDDNQTPSIIGINITIKYDEVMMKYLEEYYDELKMKWNTQRLQKIIYSLCKKRSGKMTFPMSKPGKKRKLVDKFPWIPLLCQHLD